METGLKEIERGHSLGNSFDARAMDEDATAGPTVDRSRSGRISGSRWRAAAPTLAIAFAVLTASCDDAPGRKADRDAGANERLTVAGAEVMKEAKLNRQLKCVVTRSDDLNSKQPKIKIFVPVSGSTDAERRKNAESSKAREDLKDCYEHFKVELPSQLSAVDATLPSMAESVLGIPAAHAQTPGTCYASMGGSCSFLSTEDCCRH